MHFYSLIRTNIITSVLVDASRFVLLNASVPMLGVSLQTTPERSPVSRLAHRDVFVLRQYNSLPYISFSKYFICHGRSL